MATPVLRWKIGTSANAVAAVVAMLNPPRHLHRKVCPCENLALQSPLPVLADPAVLAQHACLQELQPGLTCNTSRVVDKVGCDNGGNVVELNLAVQDLSGSLKQCLSSFTKLTKLDLSNNHLEGTIPDIFGNLKELKFL